MKQIFKTWVAFWLLAGLALMFNGCSTLPSGNAAIGGQEISPERVRRDIAAVAEFGTREGLRADQNSRAYFSAVVAIINASLDSATYDPQAIKDSLSVISIRELNDPAVADGIKVVLQLYNSHASDAINRKLDQTRYVRPALMGVRDGIARGLVP